MRTSRESDNGSLVKLSHRLAALPITRQVTGHHHRQSFNRPVVVELVAHLPESKHHVLRNVFGFCLADSTATANVKSLLPPLSGMLFKCTLFHLPHVLLYTNKTHFTPKTKPTLTLFNKKHTKV